MPFLIVFIVLALLELMAFRAVAGAIGGMGALLLLFLSVIAGSFLLRYQGLQTVLSLRQSVERGRVPVNELFEGLCMTVAALLLILPGFVSDIFALMLLIPSTRSIMRNVTQDYTHWYTQANPRNPDIIEGEYERMDDPDKIGRD